ncbi:MAG: nitroreductase family deazaflavin-dependent oxidoreductase [Anaerolineae bacterium]|nr:nitroreductase family deazaflavin-dependent oxidoreductase [Anaerolineae bacterium]
MPEQRVYNPEYLYLTTTGWKSGSPHEIEIWYVPHGSCYYLVSGGGDKAHWVKNIRHNPRIAFWVLGQRYEGSARVVDRQTEPELAGSVAGLMQAKYNWSDGWIIELCAT